MGHGLVGAVTVPSQPILTLRNLTLGYERHPAVHHLNLEVQSGALLAVVGPNGAGKTTLLRGLAGELAPLQGEIGLHGIKRQDIAYLTQLNHMEREFPITVLDMAAMGLWQEIGFARGINRSCRERIQAALELVGLQGLEHRLLHTLSGGQMQRARFARMSLQNAKLLLLDEPFNAIDHSTTEDLALVVHTWSREGRTVLTVLHDFEHVRSYYHEALLLARESVAYGRVAEVLTAANLERAATLLQHLDTHVCDWQQVAA